MSESGKNNFIPNSYTAPYSLILLFISCWFLGYYLKEKMESFLCLNQQEYGLL